MCEGEDSRERTTVQQAASAPSLELAKRRALATSGRLAVVGGILALSCLGLLGRLVDLQLIRHPQYERLASSEHDGHDTLRAHRGMILDRNGQPLALTRDAYTVFVNPAAWQDSVTATHAAQQLSALLGLPASGILATARSSGRTPVSLASGVSIATGERLASLRVPGVSVSRQAVRVYPEGDLASNLLGFVGRDGVGLTGLERDENRILAGVDGQDTFQQDAFGRPIANARWQHVPAIPGGDVTLTLDRRIQQIAEQQLDQAIAKSKASGGTVIAMDPRTGAVLALASRPSFRESRLNFARLSQTKLYRDRALTDVYEPGSPFKLITMAAAIDSGIVNAHTTYDDTGTALVDGVAIHNWDYSAHGPTTMTTVIVDSLNTGAVWVARKLGAARFYRYVHAFNFGSPTGIGLSGEAAGFVPEPFSRMWSPVELATNAYGQGIAVTPLQLLSAVSAIANGGKLMRPYIVQSTSGPGGKTTHPSLVRQVISPAAASAVRRMMRSELAAYTLAQVPGYSGGGKSGTAYIPGANGYATKRTIPSYVEFAPYHNPRIIVLVKLDNLGSNALGGVVAAPLARNIIERALLVLGVPPDQAGALPAAARTP